MMFFCYELTIHGSWAPVCYHGEKPKPEKTSEGDPARRTALRIVPDHCVDGDGSPNFGLLTKLWPAPEVAN